MLFRSPVVSTFAVVAAAPSATAAGPAQPGVTCRLGQLVRGPGWTPGRTPRVLTWWTALGSIPGHRS